MKMIKCHHKCLMMIALFTFYISTVGCAAGGQGDGGHSSVEETMLVGVGEYSTEETSNRGTEINSEADTEVSLEESEEQTSEEETESKDRIVVSEGFQVVSLGVPTKGSYGENFVTARNPWDMIIEDGKLYLGSGDFSSNAGPVDMWCYDIAAGEWSISGVANEEAIQRFIRIGNQLVTPGIDSRGSWKYGSYFTLKDGAWVPFELVPGAVHMFDIVEFDGGRFYGNGTDYDKKSPVQFSADNDETFEDVQFIKDDEELFTGRFLYDRCRVYDFFVLNGELYCTCQANSTVKTVPGFEAVFRYEDGVFRYVCDSTLNAGTTDERQIHIYEKVIFNGACYYANGKLKKTTDLQNIETLEVPDFDTQLSFGITDVEDLLVEHNEESGTDEMYVLTKRKMGDIYRSTIWKYIDDDCYEEICSIDSMVPAMSFAKNGEDFYVGLGIYLRYEPVGLNLGEILVVSPQ